MGMQKRLHGYGWPMTSTSDNTGSPAWDKLIIQTNGLDCSDLLGNWSWLLGDRMQPLFLTVFGDWFLNDEAGHIYFLDLMEGQLSQVAKDREELNRHLADQDKRDTWFMEHIAYRCIESGMRPGQGECLAFKIPPVLGGKIGHENIQVLSLAVYERIMGQIHRQAHGGSGVVKKLAVDGKEP